MSQPHIPGSTTDLWAPIIVPAVGNPWVLYSCIRYTRKGAREAYVDGFGGKETGPKYMRKQIRQKKLRFARVTVTEQTP